MRIKRMLPALTMLICLNSFGQINQPLVLLSGQHPEHRWHVTWPSPQVVQTGDDISPVLAVIGSTDRNQFTLVGRHRDQQGSTHSRYQHQINKVPVRGSELIIHSGDLGVTGFNGRIYPVTKQTPQIDPAVALQVAIGFIDAEIYQWQLATEDSMLKIWVGDEEATYYPQARLVYAPKELDFDRADWSLCFVFDIYANTPLKRSNVYIHAITGEVWAEEERIHDVDAVGTAVTRYSGTQRITTDSLNPNSFRLRETGRGGGVETYNMKKGTSYGAAVDFLDSNNLWNNANPQQDDIATDAHWGAEWTYDYFWNKFARNSFDDKGAKIRSYVHYGSKYNNAFWNGSVMTYGDGDSSVFTPLTSVDVCGHEIAHAVTTNSAGLIYKDESGALNESFSDIFGNAIEQYARPGKFSWKIGEDITPSGNGIRHMHNPNGRGHPDTYKGTNWRTGTADNGGVHSNSGVQNFWFYLLCEGGTGKNDNGDNYTVDSIGIGKAEAVAYRNLTTYLTASSNYAEARYYAIRAAEDLFGACSKEVIAVTNAWYAVGVGKAYDSTAMAIDFISDTSICHPGSPIRFVNRSSNASSFYWEFGDGDTSTQINPYHTYSGYGKFTVKLTAGGCFFGVTDSVKKVNYISIDSTFHICDAVLMQAGKWTTVRKCTGYVYDNGGENYYQTLIRDTLTISSFPSDSMHLIFTQFDFEDKYDSLYIYDGPNTSSPLIGGFTGSTLPKGGLVRGYSGYFTLRQFADPFVTGQGFKAEIKAFRKPISMTVSADTTVCNKSPLKLKASVSGGYAGDYVFYWNRQLKDSVLNLSLSKDSVFNLIVEEYCMKESLYDTIRIYVRPELKLETFQDTTVCFRQAIDFVARHSGGDTAKRVVTWQPFNVKQTALKVISDTSIFIEAILSDNCTPQNDSVSFWMHVRPALALSTSPDTTVCFRSLSKLRATASGGLIPYTLSWSHGLGQGGSKNITPDTSAIYRVILSDNCSGVNDTAQINVKVLNPISVTAGPDTLVCHSSPMKVRVEVTGGDSKKYTYSWNNGLGNGPEHQIKPTVSSTYKIVISDGCSGVNGSDSTIVSVMAPLQIDILGKDTACDGERIFYTTSRSGGRASTYAYQWNNGMGNNDNASTNALAGTNIQVILSDGCSGFPDTSTLNLFVRPSLSLTTMADAVICNGDSILVWAKASGGIPSGYEFFWDNGIGNKASFMASPKFTTKYKINLTDNCSSFKEDSVTISLNATPKIAFSASPTLQCVGREIRFTNNTPGADVYQNTWFFGDGKTSDLYEPAHTYLKPGIYNVSLKVTNPFKCSDSLGKNGFIEIIPAPVAAFDHDPEVATVANRTYDFSNKSSNASRYLWDFGDGQTDTIINLSHEYGDTGSYMVTLTAINHIGCRDVWQKKLRVKDIYLSHIPNAITPNVDGLNEVFKPYIKGLVKYEFSIYNRWGELIFVTNDQSVGWDAKSNDGKVLPSGTYFYRITGATLDGDRISETGYVRILQ